jgi:hypothetical protein
MFLDSPEPILLIFPGHPDEIPQTLFKFLGSFAGALDKPDSDPLISIRKRLEVLPGFVVGLEGLQDILWDFNIFYR